MYENYLGYYWKMEIRVFGLLLENGNKGKQDLCSKVYEILKFKAKNLRFLGLRVWLWFKAALAAKPS